MADQKVILGYWGIRGRGQPLRFALAYTGLPWEDKVYTVRDQWFAQDKPALKTPFPNIPYLKVTVILWNFNNYHCM